MNLSDGTIHDYVLRGVIGLSRYDPALVQPASIDVRLGNTFLVFDHGHGPIDTRNPAATDSARRVVIPDIPEEPFTLHPGQFALGSTLERVRLPEDVVAHINGKSSLGRVGLLVHATAGFVDPGFDGTLTLELMNLRDRPLLLWPGQRVAQLAFALLDKPAERPYGTPGLGSHYQGQDDVTSSGGEQAA